MRSKALTETLRHSSAALALAGLIVFGVSPSGAFATGSETSGPRVRNSTRSFKIIAVEKSENGDYRLSLKNEYGRAITAFRVFLPVSNTSIREDSGARGESIAPGAVRVLHISAASLSSKDDGLSSNRANVLINAVAFEDGSGDGRVEVLAEMEAERLAEKRQLTRAVTQLRKMLEASDAQLIASLDSLRPENWAASSDSEVASLLADFRSEKPSFAEAPEEAISRGIKSGLRSGLAKAQALLAGLESYRAIDDGTPSPVINSKIREAGDRLISECERLIGN